MEFSTSLLDSLLFQGREITLKPKNLIIFDMDGVIIDVSASYRDVVRQTVSLFFRPARGAQLLPSPLFDLSDLAAVKQSGGLNNDWDLTFEVICLLISLVDHPVTGKNVDSWSRYRKIMDRCEVSSLAEFLRSTERPLLSLLKQHGRYEDEFVRSLYRGDVGSGNFIKQIFQEIYLGESLFKSTYHINPAVYFDEGYILREKVLIERPLLEKLSEENVLAIATGRPRAEAEYPLTHFRLKPYFKHMLTLDDCLAEEKRILETEGRTVSLSKPDPFMLDAIIRKCSEPSGGIYYIGDMPDDMIAAARCASNCMGIGVIITAPHSLRLKKDLTEAGAGYVIDSFQLLPEIIL